MSFWLLWGAIGGAWELATWLSGNSELTMSWQVWWLVMWEPVAVRIIEAVAFVFAACVLSIHFFGRRYGND